MVSLTSKVLGILGEPVTLLLDLDVDWTSVWPCPKPPVSARSCSLQIGLDGYIDLAPFLEHVKPYSKAERVWKAGSMDRYELHKVHVVDLLLGWVVFDDAQSLWAQTLLQLGEALEGVALKVVLGKAPAAAQEDWEWIGEDHTLSRAYQVDAYNAAYVASCRASRDVARCQNLSIIMDKGDTSTPLNFGAIVFPDNEAHLCVPQVV